MKKVLSIMLSGIILISSLCAGINVFAQDSTISADIRVTYDQSEARSMFNMVNSFRTGGNAWCWNENNTKKESYKNLSRYTYDYDLEKIAMQRAAEIAVRYDHVRPNGEMFYTAYDNKFGGTCGENIAAGYTSASAAFEGWKEENEKYDGQGHRRNMLSSDFTAIGIACVYSNGIYYWVQEFRGTNYQSSLTRPVNYEKSVTIDILNSSITSSKVVPSVSEYNLTAGDSVDLPTVTAEMKVAGAWPTGISINTVVSASWSVGNTNIAKTSGNKLVAVKTGSTTLNATVNGTKISIPVNVGCNHNIVIDKAVEPTCQNTGLTEGSHCSICNEIITAQQVLPKTAHKVVKDAAVAPTCAKTGLTEGSHCSVCNKVIVKQEIVPVTDHNYKSSVKKAATCTEEGIMEYRCAGCGDSYTEPIAKTAHKVVKDAAVEATCSKTGLTEGSHCSVCNTVIVKQQVVPVTDHKYNPSVAKAATCIEEGIMEYRCAGCGDSYTESIAKTAHKPVKDAAVAPTCTKTGLTEGSHCSVCNEVIVAQQTVPVIDHTVVTDAAVAPTCTQTGLTEGSHCSVCNKVIVAQQTVPVIDHTVVTDAAVAPTCTQTGLTEGSHCSVCETIIVKQAIIDATGHNFTYEANNDGTHTKACTACDFKTSEDCTKIKQDDYYVCGLCNAKYEIEKPTEPSTSEKPTVPDKEPSTEVKPTEPDKESTTGKDTANSDTKSPTTEKVNDKTTTEKTTSKSVQKNNSKTSPATGVNDMTPLYITISVITVILAATVMIMISKKRNACSE